MSMGHSASYADVIKEATIKRLVPKEFKAFQKALIENEVDFEQFAQAVQYNDHRVYLDTMKADLSDQIEILMDKAWTNLVKAFKKATGGLELYLSYHDHENQGDRYDDVEGAFWGVDGVWTRTPAGKKFARSIDRKFYVTYG